MGLVSRVLTSLALKLMAKVHLISFPMLVYLSSFFSWLGEWV